MPFYDRKTPRLRIGRISSVGANLCPLTESWPWWLCPIPENLRFPSLLNPAEAVPREWLGLCDKIAAKITIGDE